MSVSVELSTDQVEYQVGDTITATVTVTGADGGEKQVVVSGTLLVDGATVTVDAAPVTVSWPEVPVEVVSVSADGVDFTPTDDPMVWAGTAA